MHTRAHNTPALCASDWTATPARQQAQGASPELGATNCPEKCSTTSPPCPGRASPQKTACDENFRMVSSCAVRGHEFRPEATGLVYALDATRHYRLYACFT